MEHANEIFSNGKYRVENKTVYMSGRFVLLHEWSISAGNTENESIVFSSREIKKCIFLSELCNKKEKKLFIIYGSNCSYLIRATLPKL